MNSITRAVLLASTAMAISLTLQAPAAQAQPVNGLYVAAGAGLNWGQSMTIIGTGATVSDVASRLGFAGAASVGWGFGNGLRAEIEGSWRANRLGGPNADDGLGRMDQLAVMANAFFDMNIGANWIYPYVGAGVGYAWRKPTEPTTAGAFAYQAIAGAAFPIASVPGLSFTAEYRFMGVLQTTHFHPLAPNQPLKVSNGYNHSVMLGLRYAFNAAPAAVMAPVVAPAGKSFLVFFDWDKSTLTDRARGIIREAAATSKTTQHTRVEVNGYADTSGNAKYNQGISMRRAQTVAAELVRNGVAKGEIAIKAFGDTVLLVPTGPGVREPQNRRVEIIIR